jgi:hypothetical protein
MNGLGNDISISTEGAKVQSNLKLSGITLILGDGNHPGTNLWRDLQKSGAEGVILSGKRTEEEKRKMICVLFAFFQRSRFYTLLFLFFPYF